MQAPLTSALPLPCTVFLQGRVLRSWGPVHVITQVLGLLAAIAGVIIAILAFGWKDVPGEKLYLPHKWTGVGVIGMALIQVCADVLTCPAWFWSPQLACNEASVSVSAGCCCCWLQTPQLHDLTYRHACTMRAWQHAAPFTSTDMPVLPAACFALLPGCAGHATPSGRDAWARLLEHTAPQLGPYHHHRRHGQCHPGCPADP